MHTCQNFVPDLKFHLQHFTNCNSMLSCVLNIGVFVCTQVLDEAGCLSPSSSALRSSCMCNSSRLCLLMLQNRPKSVPALCCYLQVLGDSANMQERHQQLFVGKLRAYQQNLLPLAGGESANLCLSSKSSPAGCSRLRSQEC